MLNWKLVSVCLEIVLILMQDRFVVCAKRTIGSEIILNAADGTPNDAAQVKAQFNPFGHSANIDAR